MERLALADRREMECVTRQFAPYSDFNFINLWSWDTTEEVLVSKLHGNLVVRFLGYMDSQPFLMFMGRQSQNETAGALIEHCERTGLTPELQLIPHCVAQSLDGRTFSVIEDPNHTDYIISTRDVERYDGQRFALQRNFVRRFSKLYPTVRFARLDLSCAVIRAQIRALFERWHAQKNGGTAVEREHEYRAIMRCVGSFSTHLIATGLFLDGQLIALWLGEDICGACAISHFEKAETAQFVGIVPFLRQRTAQVLREQGIEHVNLEQDLGIPGLRQSKRSYEPVAFLKKYRITRCDSAAS
jgi:hypothetical protein